MWPQFFQKQIENKQLSHAYLILSPPFCSREKIFKSLLKKISVNKEDLHLLEEATIKISHIRKLKHILSFKPFRSNYKMAILFYGEGLTKEAANSLLKILEEPPGQALIFIFISDKDAILPTVFSRCQLLRIKAIDCDENFIQDSPKIKEIFAMNLAQRFNLAQKLAENPQLKKIIFSWQLDLRKQMLKTHRFSNIIDSTHKLLSLLKTKSSKVSLLEQFFLEIK